MNKCRKEASEAWHNHTSQRMSINASYGNPSIVVLAWTSEKFVPLRAFGLNLIHTWMSTMRHSTFERFRYLGAPSWPLWAN